MNGWNIILVVFVVLAVVYCSVVTIGADAVRDDLEEARAEIKELKDQVSSLEKDFAQAVADKKTLEEQVLAAGCKIIPGTGEAGSNPSLGSDGSTPVDAPNMIALLWAMGVNLAWLSGIVIYRVYANATRNKRWMRLTQAEAEVIQAARKRGR